MQTNYVIIKGQKWADSDPQDFNQLPLNLKLRELCPASEVVSLGSDALMWPTLVRQRPSAVPTGQIL